MIGLFKLITFLKLIFNHNIHFCTINNEIVNTIIQRLPNIEKNKEYFWTTLKLHKNPLKRIGCVQINERFYDDFSSKQQKHRDYQIW
jgi:hypothetical protein